MVTKILESKSKLLSLILRHKPEKFDIKLEKDGGWANINDIINKCGFTLQELITIVDTDEKGRYSFNSDKTKIRANQGHSIDVDLKLKSIVPPIELYHGTILSNLISIEKKGLNKMNRQYVHLTDNLFTAMQTGKRRGSPIILKINSKEMYKDGYKFYKSDNDVYLTDIVPGKYIEVLVWAELKKFLNNKWTYK